MQRSIASFKQELAAKPQRVRGAAKLFAEACATAHCEKLGEALEVIEHESYGWTFAFREVAKLPKVHKRIKNWFQLHWFESKTCAYCDDKRTA